MNRTEAHMIAVELYKLMYNDMKNYISGINSVVSDQWVDVKEAASILGLSKKNIYLRIEEIPHIKVGRKYRFKMSELTKYMEGRL